MSGSPRCRDRVARPTGITTETPAQCARWVVGCGRGSAGARGEAGDAADRRSRGAASASLPPRVRSRRASALDVGGRMVMAAACPPLSGSYGGVLAFECLGRHAPRTRRRDDSEPPLPAVVDGFDLRICRARLLWWWGWPTPAGSAHVSAAAATASIPSLRIPAWPRSLAWARRRRRSSAPAPVRAQAGQ